MLLLIAKLATGSWFVIYTSRMSSSADFKPTLLKPILSGAWFIYHLHVIFIASSPQTMWNRPLKNWWSWACLIALFCPHSTSFLEENLNGYRIVFGCLTMHIKFYWSWSMDCFCFFLNGLEKTLMFYKLCYLSWKQSFQLNSDCFDCGHLISYLVTGVSCLMLLRWRVNSITIFFFCYGYMLFIDWLDSHDSPFRKVFNSSLLVSHS